jgi:hypothetical protein
MGSNTGNVGRDVDQQCEYVLHRNLACIGSLGHRKSLLLSPKLDLDPSVINMASNTGNVGRDVDQQ